MKETLRFGTLAGSMIVAGTLAPITQAQSGGLSQDMFTRLDADHDSKVSMKEYVDYGTDYLRKKGRRVNRSQMESKFAEFDRNGDGAITVEDPEYRSPKALLDERIAGTWSADAGGKTMSFVFMPDNQADVIQNGESMRDKAREKMKYKFVHLSRTPTCLDIVVDRGSDSDYYIKCIIEFISEDRMKLKMMAGSGFVVRPRNFDGVFDPDAIILTRKERSVQVALVADQKPAPRAAKTAPVEHKGIVTAKVKVKKTSDKKVETSITERPAGTMVTTTTQRIEEEVQHLTISVANTGEQRDVFNLCWYFLCRPHDGGPLRVYDKGEKKIVLDPRRRGIYNVAAKKISTVEETVEKENEDTGASFSAKNDSWGDEAEGYLVVLKHGETVLDRKSSSKEFLSDHRLSRL